MGQIILFFPSVEWLSKMIYGRGYVQADLMKSQKLDQSRVRPDDHVDGAVHKL